MDTNPGQEDEKYSTLYGSEMMRSIQPGGVYFCGMNPGPFVMKALKEPNLDGNPFFVIAQDALSDARYFNYLHKTYGAKLSLPTPEESQQFCNAFYEDMQRRINDQRLKSGKNSRVETIELESGKVFFVADEVDLKRNHPVVMHVNGLLARMIFDKNPEKQFFIKQNFPLDWVNPHLEPHGLILKITREPLTKLSPQIIERDHSYWTKIASPMIGDWLNDQTSVQEVAAFAEKVYLQHDFSVFHGDSNFVLNMHWNSEFSDERSSIGGMYAWRARQPADADDKRQMDDAADFAFRQAWALCPYAASAVARSVNFLVAENRIPDAIIVAETASKFRAQLVANQSNILANQFEQMASNLKRLPKKP